MTDTFKCETRNLNQTIVAFRNRTCKFLITFFKLKNKRVVGNSELKSYFWGEEFFSQRSALSFKYGLVKLLNIKYLNIKMCMCVTNGNAHHLWRDLKTLTKKEI